MRFNSKGERNIERDEELGISRQSYKEYGLPRIKAIKAKLDQNKKEEIQPNIKPKINTTIRCIKPIPIVKSVDEKYQESIEKWSDNNQDTLELERIFDGRREQYWKIEDRLKAVNNYINSSNFEEDKTKSINLSKITELEKAFKKFTELNSVKSYIEKNKVSKEYVDQTLKNMKTYISNLKQSYLDKETMEKSSNIIPFKSEKRERSKGLLGKIAVAASIAIIGASSFAAYVSNYMPAKKQTERVLTKRLENSLDVKVEQTSSKTNEPNQEELKYTSTNIWDNQLTLY